VWAQFLLRKSDEREIANFLNGEFGIRHDCIVRDMHITVYHAKAELPGLREVMEPVDLRVPAVETRFMVMVPGGENPLPGMLPANQKIGIRVHRQSAAMPEILRFRERLLKYETREATGCSRRSTTKQNAFGAKMFQPHMTLMLPGNGLSANLTIMGAAFRARFREFVFQRFMVEIKSRDRGQSQIASTH
jgi:hypothetical protein